MKRNQLALSLTAATLACACAVGCSTALKSDGNASSPNANVVVGNANVANATSVATPAPNNPSAGQPVASNAPATTTTGTPAPANSQPVALTSATNSAKKAPSVKPPEKQIGSGGSDFAIFAQLRGALSSDAALKNSNNIIINVSNGGIVLTGTVADEAQKSRAEQIARGVGGVKSVKNELRVAKGSAAK